MRIRAKSKLFYLPVGGALTAGLAVSAFVLPQAAPAASADCYGVCQSQVSLALSRPTVAENKERLETFSVKVGGGAGSTGQPTGSVYVENRGTVVCRIHLSHGKGHCSLSRDQLAPGSYQIVAHYNGDANFRPATSGARTLHVRANSGTLLALSRSSVTFGRERSETFSVRVGGDSRRPTGSVYVEARGEVLCRVDLSHGRGGCHLSNRQLAPGSYEIAAHYTGDAHFAPSASSPKHLTVGRH